MNFPDSTTSTSWSPTSWQNKTCRQLPHYADANQLSAAIEQLEQMPPLVTPAEIERF